MVDEIVLRFSVKDDGSPVIERVNQKIAQTGKEAKTLAPGLEDASKNLGKFAAANGALIGVLVAVGAALKYSVGQAMEAQKVDAQLNAVLESTHGVAGMTAESLDELATSLSRMSTFDDDAIKSSEALLLTFTKIGSDVFPQAQKTILDVATAMGGDLQGATIQLGKALNDPIAGISALTRIGVTFTDEQKNMIKTLVESGDVMGAQQVILKELSTEFGGSALAASKTYAGQTAILKNEVANLAEAFGADLIPPLATVTTHFVTLLTAMDLASEAGVNWGVATDKQRQEFMALAAAQAEVTTETEEFAGKIKDETIPTLEELTATTQEATAANEGLFGLVGSLQGATDSYKESTASLNEEWTELIQGYAAGTINAKEYEEGLAGVQEALGKTKEKHKEAMASIAYDLFVAKLKAGEFTDAEFQMAIDAGVAMGIIDQEVADMALNMSAAVESASGSTEKFSESLKQPISDITTLNGKIEATAAKAGMTWEYFFVINTKGSVPNMPNQDQSGAGTNAGVGYQSGFAGGGLVSGSGTGVKDSFLVPMANGEFVVRAGVVQQPGVLDLLKSLNSGRGMSGKGGNTFYNAVINVYANNPNEFMDALQGEL